MDNKKKIDGRFPIWGFLFSGFFLSIGFLMLKQFNEKGYIIEGRQHKFIVTGNDALMEIYGLIGLSSIVLLYYSIKSIYLLFFVEESRLSYLKPTEYVICYNCRTPQYAKDFPDLKCNECGNELEDLNGFYERHPELKQ